MKRVPGRDTKPAYSAERRTWYGHGTLTRAEKPPVRRYLHDVTYVFSELSVLGLPAIVLAFLFPDTSAYGVSAATLVAWLTMTAVAAGIRGGWIPPLATDVRGWLSLAPSLILLRVVYYNVVFLVVGFGSPALAQALEVPPVALALAAAASVLAVMIFPRLGESFYRWLTAE